MGEVPSPESVQPTARPEKSRFYEQVPGVKGSFIFSFIASLSLQLFVVVDPLVLSSVFLFAL
jgi:hypothetical protein